MNITVCPCCLSIFVGTLEEEDECSECNMCNVISWEEHMLRIGSSFSDAMSQRRGFDQDEQ